MAALYICASALVIFGFIYLWLKSNNNYWKKKKVVGPDPELFFGNFKDYILKKKYVGDIYKEIYDVFPNEKVVGFYRMMSPTLLIRDPDVIKHVLVHDYEVFPHRGIYFSKNKLGDSLFHADAETWKLLRSRFTATFSVSKVKNMTSALVNISNDFILNLEEQRVIDSEQELYSLARKYTVATVMTCIFGIHLNTFEDENDTAKKIDDYVFTNSLNSQLEIIIPGTLKLLDLSIYPKPAQDFFKHIVKLMMLRKDWRAKRDFVDILIQMEKEKYIVSKDNKKVLNVTDNLFAGQAFIFYVAGFVNSAVLISSMLYQLALNPEIQDKLINEVDDILEKYNGEITYECLNEMTYLNRAFDETLRMYTPTASLPRESIKDYKIPGTDVVIEKGQTVIISPFAIHRDKMYYPNPDKFEPDRFTPEKVDARKPFTYLPFGFGPRSCLGLRFGRLQTCVCIVKFLSKYRVLPSEKTEKPDISFEETRSLIYPKHGIHLNVLPR